jgi:hypothetical protein
MGVAVDAAEIQRKELSMNIGREMAILEGMTIHELRRKHYEAFGEGTNWLRGARGADAVPRDTSAASYRETRRACIGASSAHAKTASNLSQTLTE